MQRHFELVKNCGAVQEKCAILNSAILKNCFANYT